MPDVVNKATHYELVEFCKKHLPQFAPPEAKTVRRIVTEIFRFNSSNCLCWKLADTSGRDEPKRLMSADLEGAIQAAPSHTLLRDKITQLSASMRRFLRIFSICGREVMEVLQSLLSTSGAVDTQKPSVSMESGHKPSTSSVRPLVLPVSSEPFDSDPARASSGGISGSSVKAERTVAVQSLDTDECAKVGCLCSSNVHP